MNKNKKTNQKRKAPLTKIINGKRVPLCDWQGECTNKAFKEVYPSLLKGKNKKEGWSYLCRKHFQQEQKRLKGKLPYCGVD